MHPQDLIKITSLAVESYHPGPKTPDVHLSEFLSAYPSLREDTVAFVSELFYGILQVRPFLRATVKALVAADPSLHRSDSLLFECLSYLFLMRLDEVGMDGFSAVALGIAVGKSGGTGGSRSGRKGSGKAGGKSKSATSGKENTGELLKVKGLLDFLCDEDTLRHWVWDEWRGIYDEGYLETEVLGPVRENAAGIEELRAKFDRMVHGGGAHRGFNDASSLASATTTGSRTSLGGASVGSGLLPKVTTVPEPFNLTAPKPRRIPMPEKIEAGFAAKPVPKTNREPDGTAQKIARAKEEARERVKKLHESARAPSLTMRATRPSSAREDTHGEISETTQHKARPVPKYPEGHAPVRLTKAALLKEYHLITQKDAAAMNAIETFESNLRDDTANAAEAERRRAAEESSRLAAVASRRDEARDTARRAARAREKALEEKRAKVKSMREESERLKEEAQAREREESQRRDKPSGDDTPKGSARDGKNDKDGSGEDKKKRSKAEEIARAKRRSARALVAESRALLGDAAAEKEAHLARVKQAARVARAEREAATAAVGRVSGVSGAITRPDPAVASGEAGALLSSEPPLAVAHRARQTLAKRSAEVERKRSSHLAQKASEESLWTERARRVAAVREQSERDRRSQRAAELHRRSAETQAQTEHALAHAEQASERALALARDRLDRHERETRDAEAARAKADFAARGLCESESRRAAGVEDARERLARERARNARSAAQVEWAVKGKEAGLRDGVRVSRAEEAKGKREASDREARERAALAEEERRRDVERKRETVRQTRSRQGQ